MKIDVIDPDNLFSLLKSAVEIFFLQLFIGQKIYEEYLIEFIGAQTLSSDKALSFHAFWPEPYLSLIPKLLIESKKILIPFYRK